MDHKKELINAYRKKGDKESLVQLIEENKKFIYNIMKKFSSIYPKQNEADVYQAGVLGFIKAVNKYDLNKKIDILTYAFKFIEGEIFREVKHLATDLYVPTLAYQNYVKMNKEAPSDNYLRYKKFICSLDDISPERREAELSSSSKKILEIRCRFSNNNFEDLFKDDLVDKIELKNAISNLEPTSQRIIDLIYFKRKTVVEIQKILNISEYKIKKIKNQALLDMKKYLEDKSFYKEG